MNVAKGVGRASHRGALRTLLAGIGISVLVIGLAGPAGAAPSNDSFTSPTAVPPPPPKAHGVSVAGSNVGATTQPGEPSRSCGNAPNATVWFRYSPRRTHDAVVRVRSRDHIDPIDPIVAVYRVPAISEIACNDDFNYPATLNSFARFEAVRGVTYLISVDGYVGGDLGYDGEEGAFTLYVR